MKVIVAGGRDYLASATIEVRKAQTEWLAEKLSQLGATEVVSGGATGADYLGEQVAKQLGLPCKKFPANWKKYGKKAGHLRNEDMAEYADAVILFPGGNGTKSMGISAKRNNLPTYYSLDYDVEVTTDGLFKTSIDS